MATSSRSRSKRRFPISLVMIVRDEEATLERCLASAHDLVDEIIVVDTGSTDRTIDIAQQYGATIHHFTWTDDFAAARNHALAQATHPWRLILDADEWIVDPHAARGLFDLIGRSLPDFAGSIDMLQAREDGTLNDAVVPAPLIRLLPRQLSYRGRVHEQPTPEIRGVRLELLIGHDGYTKAAKQRKEGRNSELLAAAIEADPTNAYYWYQLGSEHFTRGRFDQAAPYLIEAYNLLHPEDPEAAAPTPSPWWHLVTLRLVMTLVEVKRYEDAAALAEVESAVWTESSDFFYVFGCAVRALALSLGATDRPRAEDLMVSSMGLWIRAVELGDQQKYAGALAERGTVMAARFVAQDYRTLGNIGQAERYQAIVDGAEDTALSA